MQPVVSSVSAETDLKPKVPAMQATEQQATANVFNNFFIQTVCRNILLLYYYDYKPEQHVDNQRIDHQI